MLNLFFRFDPTSDAFDNPVRFPSDFLALALLLLACLPELADWLLLRSPMLLGPSCFLWYRGSSSAGGMRGWAVDMLPRD